LLLPLSLPPAINGSRPGVETVKIAANAAVASAGAASVWKRRYSRSQKR
jgi:hypothetical protein